MERYEASCLRVSGFHPIQPTFGDSNNEHKKLSEDYQNMSSEALVIGVVALLVFGPKGLAEVARNLGKTLRSFQPTIRELQEVSRDFKNTFEREIDLTKSFPLPKTLYDQH
ncbi:hypothetical protein HPP92_028097 [Vanilla planifolia]|uniref:Uncharacterized protein n=1 Tax=Vanilla planifolia TaxID=51239 RepID=A0A835U4V3_VANPL|nr:hypothetical protein HPP92_028097 [Vanilla planifolia]